jgi:hypothetical protein
MFKKKFAEIVALGATILISGGGGLPSFVLPGAVN